MASADEGDRGLWVGPSDSETFPEPGDRADPVEPDIGQPAVPITTAVTQLMPLVVAPTSGPPVVRGIARRAAVALPALGGTDGPRDAPLSARATVDRRRAAAQAGKAASDVAVQPRLGSAGGVIPAPRSPEPSETVTEGPAVTVAPADARPGLWHLPPPEPAPEPVPGSFGNAVESVDTVVGTNETGAVVLARAPAGTDVALAARHARPAPATLATADTGEIPVVVELEPIRTLPPVLDADSWDSAPDAHPHTEDYLGRRRATSLPLRIWVIIALVLLGLGAAILIPLALGSPSTPQAGAGPAGDGNAAPTGFIPHNEGELISATSAPGAAEPTRSAAPAGPAPTTTPASTTPPFQRTLNAVTQGAHQSWQVQANTVCGSGQVVLTGLWEGQSNPGVLTYSSVSVPATGNYFMTISYGTSPGIDRTEEIRVNNASVDPGGSFTMGCKSRKIQVNLNKTTGNTITFTNQNSRGISISQIVISTS